MALTETTRNYEILIRLNADSTFGAQLQTITEIARDGVVISANINSPISLATAEGTEGTTLTEVLGDVATQALAANETLQGQVAALDEEVGTLQTQVDSLTQENTALKTQVQTLLEELASYQSANQSAAGVATES